MIVKLFVELKPIFFEIKRRKKMWKLEFLLFLLFVQGCQQSSAVSTVENFLTEGDTLKKLQYIRDDNDSLYKRVLSELSAKYLYVEESKENLNDNEIIVNVVLDKVLVGSKTVDKFESLFVLKEKESYKIDLDASFVNKDTTLDLMKTSKVPFSKEVRAYVSPTKLYAEGVDVIVRKQKVLMWLNDQKQEKYYCVLNEDLYEELERAFHSYPFAHVILLVSYSPEDDVFIADSLLQKGWIKDK